MKIEKNVSELDTQEGIQQKEHSKVSVDTTEKSLDIAHIKMELHDLKDLVEEGVVDKKIISEIAKDGQVDDKEISQISESFDVQKIFESLDRIEKIPDIDSILPKEYRILSQEYTQALSHKEKALEVLDKIDQTFDFLYMQHGALDKSPIRKFALFTGLLHKRLEQTHAEEIHDVYIDMKNTLQS